MNEARVLEIARTLVDLGFSDTPIGILKARRAGLLTPAEVTSIFDFAYERGRWSRDWWRPYVWTAPT